MCSRVVSSYHSSRTQWVTTDGIKSAIHHLLYGVPQSVVLGPILFCIYILHIGKIIRKHGFTFHIYADDTQVYIGFKPDDAVSVLERLEKCVEEIRVWMYHHKLKLNNDKPECMIISTKNKVKMIGDMAFHIGASDIPTAKSARNLGVMMESVMNMDVQVTAICKAGYYQLHNIGAIRRYLTTDVTAQLICAFVTSRLN